MSARGLFLVGLGLLAVLLFVPFLMGAARAQGCQTIFLPDGRMLICCTTGGITSCF